LGNISTQDLFVGAAVLLNKLISSDGVLDIRVLSALEILAFLVVCYQVMRVAEPMLPLRWNIAIALALIFVLCDVGYASYFNSFYCEPSTFICLLAMVAIWLRLTGLAGTGDRQFVLFGIFAVLFVASKPQNVPAAVILSVICCGFTHWSGGDGWRRRSASASSLLRSRCISQPRGWSGCHRCTT
jgi:hypothetical protein